MLPRPGLRSLGESVPRAALADRRGHASRGARRCPPVSLGWVAALGVLAAGGGDDSGPLYRSLNCEAACFVTRALVRQRPLTARLRAWLFILRFAAGGPDDDAAEHFVVQSHAGEDALVAGLDDDASAAS